MSQHALLSPSGFKALMLCPAKPAMERGRPDSASKYADEGTAAHFLGAWCLERGEQAPLYLGRKIVIWVHPESDSEGAAWGGDLSDGSLLNSEPVEIRNEFAVTEDFAEHVQTYVDTVRDYLGDGQLFVEQALPIDHVTGEEGAEGTGDAVIVRGDELIVGDLKFGQGVEVQAEDNPQLKLYALGGLRKFDLVGDIARVRVFICQPRAGGTTEAVYTVEELGLWASNVAQAAAWEALTLYREGTPEAIALACRPHADACRFCKAKGDCPALDGAVSKALGHDFTDLTTADAVERDAIVATSVTTAQASGGLGARMDAVELVELWCKAIRARVEKELLEGRPVPGYKLVAGRKGARAWVDPAEAEKLLRKTFRFKVEDAYELSLISPTKAEKLLKPTPKRWAKAQALITQNDGKPSVAPVSDSRPALEVKPLESEFTPITSDAPATADDLV